MTLVYCMYNKYVDNYKMLNLSFNKINTLAPCFPFMDLLNIFEVFARLRQSKK